FEEKEADLFHFHQTNDFINLREGKLKDFYEYFKGKEVKKLIEEITGIKLKAKIDMAGSLYKDTNFLLCHDDELSGRKIAFLIYLPKNFEEKDGGSFVLFDSKNEKPLNKTIKYLPKWNSFLMFEVSKISFHEVEEVIGKKERYAIGGWFH
ncbi:MAG: 2OG-Fe(II) oxygenase family protein, partial [Nanoarchaeota archaeon]